MRLKLEHARLGLRGRGMRVVKRGELSGRSAVTLGDANPAGGVGVIAGSGIDAFEMDDEQ